MPDYKSQETARACGNCGWKCPPGTERCPNCGNGNLVEIMSVGAKPPKVQPVRLDPSTGEMVPAGPPRVVSGEGALPYDETQKPGFFQRLKAALSGGTVSRSQFWDRLRHSPNWNVSTKDGRWVCPYCGKAAGRVGRGPGREHAVLAHLSGACPSYRVDRKPLTAKELRDRAHILDIKSEAASLLGTHPLWKFRDLEGGLICPYCAEPTDAQFPPGQVPSDASLDVLAEHLAKCPEFAPGRQYGQTPTTLEDRKTYADEIVRVKRVARKCAVQSPEWKVWDEEELWFCCFCAQGTAVHLPEGTPLTEKTIREMAVHLADCEAYARGRGEPKPVEELEAAVDRWNRERRVMKELTTRFAVLSNWQRIDRYGNWLCPYCEGPIFQIPPAERDRIADTLPAKARRHFRDECGPFKAALFSEPIAGEAEDKLIVFMRALEEPGGPSWVASPEEPPPPGEPPRAG